MSTTNGAGEPSMEEILASIRNIIAQDPEAPEEQPGVPKSPGSAAPVNRAADAKTSETKAPPADEPFRPAANAPAAPGFPPLHSGQGRSAGPAGSTGEQGHQSPQRPDPVLPRASAPNVKGEGQTRSDDLSDVFEEPIPSLSIAPSPFQDAQTGTSDTAKSGPFAERSPGLPFGSETSEDDVPTAVGASKARQTENGESSYNGTSGLDSRAGEVAGDRTGAGKAFDFGAFRAPKKETEKAPMAAKPAAAGGLTDGSQDKASKPGEGATVETRSEMEPKRTVIAAMTTQPKDDAGGGDAGKSAGDPGKASSATASDKDDPAAGFKTANVGFLAATPRPLDTDKPAAAGFFKAVAGEAADRARPADALSGGANGSGSRTGSAWGGQADRPKDEKPPEVPAAHPAAAETATGQSSASGLSVANLVVSSENGRVKTLEDTVAELLRPLLREWLENNMPRIVENALRLEVADSVKKQLEAATSKPNGLGK